MFWSIKIRNDEVLNKLKFRSFCASSLSTYDFPTLYTTLPHNPKKKKKKKTKKLHDIIEWTFDRKGSLYLVCNGRNVLFFFTSEKHRNYTLWSCQKVFEALTNLLDPIYIRYGTKLFIQIVGIPMGTDSTPLVANLFLFCF